MHSHELAKQLTKLARILKEGPDFDLDFSDGLDNFYRSLQNKNRNTIQSRNETLPIALDALLSLSSIDKHDWRNLILDLNLPIDIRPRDASRDLLGKVLKVLEVDQFARSRLRNIVRHSSSKASPELMKALSSLLSK